MIGEPGTTRIIIGITCVIGITYAVCLLRELEKKDFNLHGVFSRAGEEVLRYECNAEKADFPGVTWHEHDDMRSELASGTGAADCMVVVPCSMNTIGLKNMPNSRDPTRLAGLLSTPANDRSTRRQDT